MITSFNVHEQNSDIVEVRVICGL